MFPCKMLRRKPDKIFLKVFSLVSPPLSPPSFLPVDGGQLLLLLLHEELQVKVLVLVPALPSPRLA